MDDKARHLLGPATVALASLGLASVPGAATPQDQALSVLPGPGSSRPGPDLLVELVLRTGGSHSVEALGRELRQMLSYMTPERLEQLPDLIRGIRSLGLEQEAEEALLVTLIEVIADMDLPLDERQVERLADALTAEPEQALLVSPDAGLANVPSEPSGSRGIGTYGG